MPTICRAYASEQDAHAAVERLVSAGVESTGIRVLSGEAEHDTRDAPAGTYAGRERPADEEVGAYAGAAHTGRDAMGGFAGDPDAQRRGGFADVDRETVTTYHAGVERMHVASHAGLRRMLVEAGLDEAAADADVDALHRGRVLVLVQSPRAAEDVAAALDA
jgi:hypothetical protein